ncbi:MAG: glutamate 5-kinase [Candidatus Omnitrophica bacterium]|nr:glutamate 5-kinase [Candidatus Omnitrophota bacterium]MCF7893956.1 glutamate 5-kinase [Candidatus Omnitrophota bacterium]
MGKTIVVKIGSSIIAPLGKVNQATVRSLVKDIFKVKKLGFNIVLVTSGAVASGLGALGYRRKPNNINSLMAISSFGQIILMDLFNKYFKQNKGRCAQVLLTWDDFNYRRRFLNIKKTLGKLFSLGVIPIVNENDVVSHQEIRWGDNDYLSALVADLIDAKQLILLSDVEGLFKGKELVKRVEKIDETIEALVEKQANTHTSGGMETKLEAATKATLSGIETKIVSGLRKNVISDVVKGKDIGTLFVPVKNRKKSRKRWIDSKQIKGSIVVDKGAKEALLNKGRSLLSVGISEVTQGFQKGDAVAIVDENNNIIGTGIVNYNWNDLGKKKRLKKEVIHRDNFVKSVPGWSYHPYYRFIKKGLK